MVLFSNFASGRTLPTQSTGPQPIQLVPWYVFCWIFELVFLLVSHLFIITSGVELCVNLTFFHMTNQQWLISYSADTMLYCFRTHLPEQAFPGWYQLVWVIMIIIFSLSSSYFIFHHNSKWANLWCWSFPGWGNCSFRGWKSIKIVRFWCNKIYFFNTPSGSQGSETQESCRSWIH